MSKSTVQVLVAFLVTITLVPPAFSASLEDTIHGTTDSPGATIEACPLAGTTVCTRATNGPGGAWTISGLTPAAEYVIHVRPAYVGDTSEAWYTDRIATHLAHLAWAATPVMAGSPTSYDLHPTSGNHVAGNLVPQAAADATVSLLDASTAAIVGSMTTGPSGYFELAVPDGDYILKVEAPGYLSPAFYDPYAGHGLGTTAFAFPEPGWEDPAFRDLLPARDLAEATSPVVVSTSPAMDATNHPRNGIIKVTFSKDLIDASVNEDTIRLIDWTAGGVLLPVTVTELAGVVTIKPTSLLPAGHALELRAEGNIRDTFLNFFASSWVNATSFTVTKDATKPAITKRLPTRSATSVTRTGNLSVTFSEQVKNVTGSRVRLRNTATGKYVAAVVTYSSRYHRVTINPSVTLSARRKYQIVIGSGITDIAGNPLSSTSWTFTTRR